MNQKRKIYTIMKILYQTTRCFCHNRTMDDDQKCSLYSLVFKIQEVDSVLKQKSGNYDLSEVQILGIQNSLLSGRYNFSPLRLYSEYGDSPRSNSKPSFLVEPSNPADLVVIGALGAILIDALSLTSYFRNTCFSTYKGFCPLSHYHSTIQEWRGVETLLRLNCSNSYITFPRSRLLEKVKTIVHNEQLVDLIKSFCNLPIVDDTGRVLYLNTCFPPMIFIGDTLLNIILDDIDHEMGKLIPKQNFARMQHEILIPIFDKDNDGLYTTVLDALFNQCHFIAPAIERAVRGGEPIPFSGGIIHINEDGQILIQSDG